MCGGAPFGPNPPKPHFRGPSALPKRASPSHSQSPHRAPNSAPFREPTPAPSSPSTIADAVAAASTVSPVRVAMDGGSPIPRPTLFPSPHQFQCANWGCYTRPNSWLLPPSPWISPSACFRLVVMCCVLRRRRHCHHRHCTLHRINSHPLCWRLVLQQLVWQSQKLIPAPCAACLVGHGLPKPKTHCRARLIPAHCTVLQCAALALVGSFHHLSKLIPTRCACAQCLVVLGACSLLPC